jgi:hypothetical protein
VPPSNTISITDVSIEEYTLQSDDYVLNVKTSDISAEINIIVPLSECYRGRTFIVKDATGSAYDYNIIVSAEGERTPLFEGDVSEIRIRDNYRAITFYYNGENIMILSIR